MVHGIALGAVNPCGLGAAGTALKGLNGLQAVGNALNLGENIQNGNYGAAALDGLALLGNVAQMSRACFAAGTPLLTPDGSKPIEQFRAGDLLLSAPEDDPSGAVAPRRVEEVFQRTSPLVTVKVGGQMIRTTDEHPFFVRDKGWTKASLLTPGDLLRSHDGRWLPLASIESNGEVATVYNLRIAEYHTYFVGAPAWGFSVWSHNTSCDSRPLGKDLEANGISKPPGSGWEAAHLVPTGAWSGRSLKVQQAVRSAQRIIGKTNLNKFTNGFWPKGGHLGTHRDIFLKKLANVLPLQLHNASRVSQSRC